MTVENRVLDKADWYFENVHVVKDLEEVEI